MPAQLIALDQGPSILIDKPILLIGRHPECDIQIESRKISRRHCCIAQVHDYLVIRDLDSTNGIRINGIRQVEGKLKIGDEVTIGNHVYKVVWQDGAREAIQGRAKVVPAPSPRQRECREEDELLESCDEPIALPDRKRSLNRHSPDQSPDEDRTEGHNRSALIPDDLNLLPKSDIYRNLARPE